MSVFCTKLFCKNESWAPIVDRSCPCELAVDMQQSNHSIKFVCSDPDRALDVASDVAESSAAKHEMILYSLEVKIS